MAEKLLQSKVIAVAEQEIGYLEKKSNAYLDDKTANAGAANYTKYWRDLYPNFQGEAWCNAFVNWCFVQAYGEESAKKLLCTTGAWSFYTPTSAQYFKNANQWYSSPQVGDIIYFKNSSRIHHVGLVYKVNQSYVFTIEGNTSSVNEVVPNGGGVYAKQYLISNPKIAGYGRPAYDTNEANVIDIPIFMSREGLKVVGAESLNIRSAPLNGTVIGTYSLGTLITATAKALASDGSYWFKTDKGYISGKYLEGWIKESNDRWWYIKKGYTYPCNEIVQIYEQWFAFDKDGWMLTADRFNGDGSILY